MTYFFLEAHSGWSGIVLLLILITGIKALVGWLGNQKWKKIDSQLMLFSQISVRVQFVLGLILFILLQKWNGGMAFIGSHVIPGILAVGAVEFGAARAKKSKGKQKFMFAFIGMILALILVYGALATVGGLFA
ncbi:MAG: hypothetical protein AAF485_15810 [Chloroflexota bacterium]